ncbi:hypothetical protein EMIHUDRAFT_206484 [Emiliania huxleyi CCMP1516]|uniref:ZNF598/HEL2 PAH domain-containing protein n=2 Tax=Emiliania huxleyi TaxID=2903 RepID=A0A0D3JLY4_EMIH1|nr:hypothetical protein EMIHUDRAFT_206484 [Emiliania huxleyi CCMP1516]EOD24519.1 hypothetical protein EMIHUDRAFT_206484 [Emiliania huxleyi CCMP1516]|eukprot:XP_005776948.1 hypothetical protein EMIHUDRAFT_206484 [Emiliania huxleyi CCMP1516]
MSVAPSKKLTDCDPISLEPLRRLRVEPFELAASEETSHSYFFDARLLASYLVSSGSFAHPISRRELTRDDCVRLDAHLRKHRLGKACVEHAWENKEDYKRQNAATSQEEFVESVPLGGAQISSAADFPSLGDASAFPSLGGGPAPRPSSSAAGVGGWSRAVASAAPAPPPTMAQTAFASAEPPPSIDSAEAFPTLGAAMRSGVPPARRLDRDELVRRNRSLQAALSGSLAGEGRERGMGLFKVASLAFQRGASDATAYIAAFVHVFGNEAALVHLPELIALCPDAPKQADLGRAFDVFRAERLAERGAAVERSAAGVGTFGRGGRSNGWGRGGRRGGG